MEPPPLSTTWTALGTERASTRGYEVVSVMSSYNRWIQLLPPTSWASICMRSHQSNRVIASALLFLAVLYGEQALGQGASSPDQQKNIIHGVVVNSVTHEPVGRALVFSPDNRFATIADDQGHFEFPLPQPTTDPTAPSNEPSPTSPGEVRVEPAISNFPGVLMARKPGFLSSENRSWISNRVLVDKEKDLTITLVPEGLIVGRVILPTFSASDLIEVELYRRQVQEGRVYWIKAGSERTRANGDFRFAELEAGTYKLLTREMLDRDPLTFDPQGQLYGYPPVYFPNATDFATAGSIQLTPGVTFQAELSPLRQRYYPVKVAVTNGPPDVPLNINVSAQGRKGPGYSLGYNARDQRIEGLLPNGTYVVEASNEGLNPATGSATIIVKGAALEGVTITLVPHSSVRVNAKLDFKHDPDPDRQSDRISQNVLPSGQWRRQNLNLRLEPADEFADGNIPQLRPPTGPHDDSLVFDNVAPGRYWVRIDPTRGFAASIRSGEIDLLRQPLTVRLGSSRVVDVTVRDDGAEIVGAIEGLGGNSGRTGDSSVSSPRSFTVRFSSGDVPAFVYCVPLPDSTGQFRQAWVSPDGKFNLQQVPPGAYRVLAFDRQQPALEYRNSEAMRAYDSMGQVVRLVAGQKENLRLQPISTSE